MAATSNARAERCAALCNTLKILDLTPRYRGRNRAWARSRKPLFVIDFMVPRSYHYALFATPRPGGALEIV
jgi:hypothetical protein